MKLTRKTILLAITTISAVVTLTCMHSEKNTSSSSPRGRKLADALRSGYAIGSELCGEFPRVQIGSRPGTCVGLVASREDGLINARNIVQLPGTKYMLVIDQVPRKVVKDTSGNSIITLRGKVYSLDPTQPTPFKLKILLDGLDTPMGLAIGPNDGLVYVGLADQVIRFDAKAAEPAKTVEVVARGFPVRNLVFPNLKEPIAESNHSQKQIVFDHDGNLYVNVGSPTDNCSDGTASSACLQASGTKTIPPMAAIWKFSVEPGKSLPALKEKEINAGINSTQYKVFAKGLRNSMAMAIHPTYPQNGVFIQAENSRDLPGQDRPNEEINLIEEGKNYGWPYCYDLDKTNSEYTQFTASGLYANFCKNPAAYQPPFSLMPAHVAPLGATYYFGSRFPELQNTLLVGWHGYIATGSRLVFYKTDAGGRPVIENHPIQYRKNCDGDQTHTITSDGDAVSSGAQFEELISDWYQVSGVRPKGAPVGLTVSEDGAIWVVEDKNATVLRIDVDPSQKMQEKLPCDGRKEEDVKLLYSLIQKNPANKARLTNVRKVLGEKYCSQCHGGFDLKPEMNEEQRDLTFARNILTQNNWVFMNDPEQSQIHIRTRRIGLGASKPMPPNWADIANNADYKKALDDLDKLILTLVPGVNYYAAPQRAPVVLVRDNNVTECGRIPTGTVVAVQPEAKPSRKKAVKIFKPESRYLSQPCVGNYYIPDNMISKTRPAGQ